MRRTIHAAADATTETTAATTATAADATETATAAATNGARNANDSTHVPAPATGDGRGHR